MTLTAGRGELTKLNARSSDEREGSIQDEGDLTPIAPRVAASWGEAELFLRPAYDPKVLDLIEAVRSIADDSGLANHPFFPAAAEDPDLLRLWVSQEAVVTGPFSQLLLLVAANLWNVHVRAVFLDLVVGEHGPVTNGVASRSHPYLLRQLARSVGLSIDAIEPLSFTIEFLADIESEIPQPLSALGALGVGNERLLIGEYGAVHECFRTALPDSDYEDFLTSNIEEDHNHSALAEVVAASLVTLGADLVTYEQGASAGVDARLRYYDSLMAFWASERLPASWRAEELVDITKPPSHQVRKLR